MGAASRWLLWTTTALAAVTGLVYAAMRYLMTGTDPFSAYNHPLQPVALHAHVLVVPVLLFAIGWFWGRHVVPKLRSETVARRSGISLIALIAVMTVSGYGLQVADSPAWRLALAWSHGISGAGFAGLLGTHALVGLRAVRRRGGGPGRPSRAAYARGSAEAGTT